MSVPNIVKGQIALDPVNDLLYYIDESNVIVSKSLSWLKNSDNISTIENVVISGNLTVSGTTVTVSSETLLINDNIIVLNNNVTAAPTENAGIEIERGSETNVSIRWNETTDKWQLTNDGTNFYDIFNSSGITGNLTGNVTGNVTGNLTGNSTGTHTGAVVGNASTATTLATLRTIAGQSFDGSANISIAPTDLTGVTSTASELNILDGVTATAAELNVLDGITSSVAELNILDGVTSSAAELNILDGATLSTTELNYVDGVTSAIQTQIDTRAPIASPTFTGIVTIPTGASITAPTGLVKGDVGLGNVDNTSNATERAATATLTNKTLTSPVINTPTGIVKGDVGLGSVDNTVDTAKPVSTAQQTAINLKANIASPTFTGNVSGITATMIGLGSVDNTADTAKPVSTAQQTAIALKANIASPTFTGTVTTPILVVDDIEVDTTGATSGQVLKYNGTKFAPATESGPTGPAGPATTDASLLISGILPDARLSAAIARISSPTFTGIPIAPTAAAATNTTQIATTAFVIREIADNVYIPVIDNLDDLGDVTIATTYAIGDTGPAGGKIFITPSTVGNSTGKYFEVAPATETERFTTWATNVNSNQTTAVVGAGGTAIGTGEQNTIDIVAQSGNVVATCAATYAANFSYGLFSDWFLPSKDELAELFTHQASIGGFVWPSYGAFMYWSSTEADFDYAWINSFGSGYNAGNTSGANLKSYVYGIARAVRSFTPTSAANGDLLKWNGTAWVNDSALLAAKAPLASPVLTGTPTAPTAAAATNTTQVATTAFVRAEVAALVNSAGATLDTLGEIATALGNDASLSTTLTNSIALKAPLVSPTFTGTVTLPANTVTSSMILDETIANIDISSSAAIDLGKLADATIKIETASYTLQLTDKNKFIKMNITSTANTVTVPLDATVTFPEGSQIHIIQYGSGKTEVVGASGAVYIYRTPGSFLRAQYSSATLLKCAAANTWMLMGDLSAT